MPDHTGHKEMEGAGRLDYKNMREETTWNHSRLLFWVNILRMKYSFFVVLVFSLLFGSPSVDVTREKFE